jgi:hypothetical protein
LLPRATVHYSGTPEFLADCFDQMCYRFRYVGIVRVALADLPKCNERSSKSPREDARASRQILQ